MAHACNPGTMVVEQKHQRFKAILGYPENSRPAKIHKTQPQKGKIIRIKIKAEATILIGSYVHNSAERLWLWSTIWGRSMYKPHAGTGYKDTYDLSTGGCIHGNINIGMGKSSHIHQYHSAACVCTGSYLKTTAISLSWIFQVNK